MDYKFTGGILEDRDGVPYDQATGPTAKIVGAPALFTVTKSVEIDYGHRVPHHTSKCANVHGHRGKIEVTVRGPLAVDGRSDEGMVMDFGDVKKALNEEIVSRFDHIFIIDRCDVKLLTLLNIPGTANSRNTIGRVHYVDGFGHIQEVAGAPTAENLAFICFQLLSRRLNSGQIAVVSVRFWETPTSVAEFSKE